MKYINTEKQLTVKIDFDLLNEVKHLAIKYFPNEFGGYLVGCYTEDKKTAVITDIILPDVYISSPVSFQRSVNSPKELFERLYKEENKYYLGEWHSHPNGSSMYSQADLNALKNIANYQSVLIINPILLISTIDRNNNFDYSFYLYDNNKLLKYE